MSTNNSNVRKKLVSKSNNKNAVNKKIFTGDKNEEETTATTNYPNGVSVKTKKIKVEIEELDEETKKQRILVLQEKTAELEQQLNSLKAQFEINKTESLENIQNINTELEKKNEESKKVSKENKKLIIKLKGLEEQITEKYNKIMNKNIYKKVNNNTKNENNVEKDIKVTEKEIENVKKMSENERKIKEKYENLINEVNNQLESNKISDLEQINEEINQLKTENEILNLIKLEHENCIKDIRALTSKLNIANNELEFETKKNDMIMSITLKKENKDKGKKDEVKTLNNVSEDIAYLKEKNALVEEKLNYSKKIRDKDLKNPISNIQKVNNITFKYIQTEFNSMQKKSNYDKKLIGNLKEVTSRIDNVYIPELNLFTEREADILRKILPDDILNSYMEKFEKKKVEKEKIEEKNEIKEKNENNNEQIFYDIDLIKMKRKTEERKKASLNIKYYKNKKKITDFKSKINELQKQIIIQNTIINRMNKNIKNYTKKVDEMKNNKL